MTLRSEDILFRIWLYRSAGRTEGVIDLMRRMRGRYYLDAMEAEINEDRYGVLRLVPRRRGKDIPGEWHPIIETLLLAPVITNAVKPYHEHVFGEGKLHKVLDAKFKFSEFVLRDVKIISPRKYKYRGGGLIGDDWPDNYDVRPTVFLCHSSKDKLFVRRLAKELLEKGLDVWLDEKRILVGQSFIDRMQDGIKEADFIAVVLTPNFLKGPWANQELQVALSHEVLTGRVKVLPVLRRDCEIPGFLSIKTYVDFRGNKFKKGIEVLVQSIFDLLGQEST